MCIFHELFKHSFYMLVIQIFFQQNNLLISFYHEPFEKTPHIGSKYLTYKWVKKIQEPSCVQITSAVYDLIHPLLMEYRVSFLEEPMLGGPFIAFFFF